MSATAPVVPRLSYVFTIKAEVAAPLSAGAGPLGERLHIAITGGTVEGPRLKGRIIPGGSDWPLIRHDGTSDIDASYTVIADDETPIFVRSSGLRVSSPSVLTRLRAGEVVDPSEYYFRTFPRFETPAGEHAWLNRHLFVGSACPVGHAIEIAVYKID